MGAYYSIYGAGEEIVEGFCRVDELVSDFVADGKFPHGACGFSLCSQVLAAAEEIYNLKAGYAKLKAQVAKDS